MRASCTRIGVGFKASYSTMGDPLDWESTYAIARQLLEAHPEVDLVDVSLEMVFRWTISLPDFNDDPELANDEILLAIYREWFEELNPI